MSEQELDDLYTRACHTMNAVGADKSELYLARLSLLLMHALDDPVRIRAAIEAAAQLEPAV